MHILTHLHMSIYIYTHMRTPVAVAPRFRVSELAVPRPTFYMAVVVHPLPVGLCSSIISPEVIFS